MEPRPLTTIKPQSFLQSSRPEILGPPLTPLCRARPPSEPCAPGDAPRIWSPAAPTPTCAQSRAFPRRPPLLGLPSWVYFPQRPRLIPYPGPPLCNGPSPHGRSQDVHGSRGSPGRPLRTPGPSPLGSALSGRPTVPLPQGRGSRVPPGPSPLASGFSDPPSSSPPGSGSSGLPGPRCPCPFTHTPAPHSWGAPTPRVLPSACFALPHDTVHVYPLSPPTVLSAAQLSLDPPGSRRLTTIYWTGTNRKRLGALPQGRLRWDLSMNTNNPKPSKAKSGLESAAQQWFFLSWSIQTTDSLGDSSQRWWTESHTYLGRLCTCSVVYWAVCRERRPGAGGTASLPSWPPSRTGRISPAGRCCSRLSGRPT